MSLSSQQRLQSSTWVSAQVSNIPFLVGTTVAERPCLLSSSMSSVAFLEGVKNGSRAEEMQGSAAQCVLANVHAARSPTNRSQFSSAFFFSLYLTVKTVTQDKVLDQEDLVGEWIGHVARVMLSWEAFVSMHRWVVPSCCFCRQPFRGL